MLRRAYLINVIVSAIGTFACMAITPTTTELLDSVRQSFNAHALNSAMLSPIVFRMITPRSN
jgi:hypothetical protein